MDVTMGVSTVVFGLFSLLNVITGQEQCSEELWCEQGHCCGSDGTHCCTYYYELWWFWMIWGLIIMLSCCCLYQQHRLKKRQRRALRALQAGVHHGSFSGYPPVSRDSDPSTTPYAGSEIHLPSYSEVQDLPKDPPAYEVLFESGRTVPWSLPASGPVTFTVPCQNQASQQPADVTDTPTQAIDHSDNAGLLDNEAVPEEDPPPAYIMTSSSIPVSPVTSQHYGMQ